MMTVAQIVSAFREIIGWPYVSPGSNNQNGIDCSGAFVYAYRKYNLSIYHGSNRMIRVYCHDVQKIGSLSQLTAGMAIFKSRTNLSQLSADYKPGGKYYNPSLPNDYYHVGLVASVNPLQIINATTPQARVDTVLSKWSDVGYLNAVNYDSVAPESTDPSTPTTPTTPVKTAVTAAPSGSTVNLRKQPSKSSVVLIRVPLGQTVTVLDVSDETWWKVKYQNTTGYMMQEFLKASA